MQTRRTVTWLMPLRGLALSRVATGDFGDPIPIRGWSPDELQCFTDGRAASEEVEEAADGLGLVLNGTSCAGCHNVGAIGGCSEVVETRFGGGVAGTFDSLPEHFDPLSEDGGSLIQTDGIGLSDRRVPAGIGTQGACNFVGEVVPAEATADARPDPVGAAGVARVRSVCARDVRSAARGRGARRLGRSRFAWWPVRRRAHRRPELDDRAVVHARGRR